MNKQNFPLENVKEIESAELKIKVRNIDALAVMFAQKNKEKELMKKINIDTKAGQAYSSQKITIIPIAPCQWIVEGDKKNVEEIKQKIKGLGYMSEQSASRACVRITGQKAQEFMSRGCMLDLHPSVVKKGYCAQTIMAQIGTTIHIVDEKPEFDIYIYAGFAESFWKWIDETAKQFIV